VPVAPVAPVAPAAAAAAAAGGGASSAGASSTGAKRPPPASAPSDEEDVVEDKDEVVKESNIEGKLHTDGFVIIPGTLDLPDKLIKALKKVNYEEAGLPQAPDIVRGYDPRRLQSRDSRCTVTWIVLISKLVSDHLSFHGLMTTSSGTAKELKHVHVLKSLANVAYDESMKTPQDGDQSKHMDESPEYVATFMQQEGRTAVDMPLSVLVALEAAARLWVWRRADERPSLIRLDPGGVLVFRGDLCHAGAGYRLENVRVHMYLYHPAYHPPPSSIYECPPV
jgi:hypothetical protein